MNKLIAILTALSLTGCANIQSWVGNHQAAIKTTAEIVAMRAATIVGQTVLAAAVSQLDANNKADYLDSLQTAFWSKYGAGQVLVGDDIKKIVAAWTPDKPQWSDLGQQFADLWNQFHPTTDAQVKDFIAAYVNALQQSAATARTI